jgi:hypothetical protein
MVTISGTRSIHFSAAHSHGPRGLSDARGRNVYGARSNRIRAVRHHNQFAIVDRFPGLEPES